MKLVMLLVAAPALLAAQPTSPFKPISLQEAVALAQANAPSAVQARGAIQNAEGTIRTTRNSFYPTLSASAGNSYGFEGPLSSNTGLSASYTVFDGGKRRYDLDARQAELHSAEVAEAATSFNLALQVKQQYYAILAAREAEAAARIALDQAQQQYDASIARVKAGVAIISDSLRSFVAVGNAQLQIITAQNNARNASAALTRLTGSSELVTAQPADTAFFAITPIDSATILRLALEGPTVRQATASSVSAAAAVKSSRSSYLPTISTGLSYSMSGSRTLYGVAGPGTFFSEPSKSVSLRASYNIWDGYARAEALNRAQVSELNAQASLRDARLLAQQNVLQQVATLRTAEERIRIQQLSLQAAEEDLRVQQSRYTNNSSTLLEVTTSQTALNNARSALISARLDYRIARAQIEAIIGQDLK